MKKILVVDDHVLIRSALRQVLESLTPAAELLEAEDCRRAMSLVEQHDDIELALLDLTLPDGDGIGLLTKIRKLRPAIGLVVLSAYDDPPNIDKAFALGALGFIPKSSTEPIIASALRLIFAGGQYLPPGLLAKRGFSASALAKRSEKQPPEIQALGLTDRQLEVLALVVQGYTNKKICRALDIHESTVKIHVSAGLRALNAATRAEAVANAVKLGLEFPIPRAISSQAAKP
jgi:DNA-binding NarL/FixJ family response regulator